jgi:hypothetical protein
MFGNRIGWGISVCIVMLVGFLLILLHKRGTEPQPPTFVGLNAARWTLDAPIQGRRLATWMTAEGDSSVIYQRIIRHFDANSSIYTRFLERRAEMPVNFRDLEAAEQQRLLKDGILQRLKWEEYRTVNEGIDLLVKAKNIKSGGVFRDRPDAIITYDRDLQGRFPEELSKLMRVAYDTANIVARVEQTAGNHERHRDIRQAMFSLGTHLCEERLLLVQWLAGRDLQGVAQYLGEYEQDEAIRKDLATFAGSPYWAGFARDNVEPLQKAILLTTKPHTGDMAALARTATDHAWRIEGILALGRCKFSGQSMGDKVGARRLLEKLATDPDPRIARAAAIARDLPVEEFHKLRLW